MDTPATAMISLKNVTKRFGSKTIIDSLNLDIPKNKITVIMGGSGHGKSTIIKLILGFITPEEGEIIIDGKNLLTLDQKIKTEVLKK